MKPTRGYTSEARMKKTTTYGLTLAQLAGLFAMGADEPDPTGERDNCRAMSHFLCEQLTSPLSRHLLLFDTLAAMIDQQGYDTRPLAGRSLGEVLLSCQSDLDLLRRIKDCSKKLSRMLDSPADAALATTIYFAAMASAMVYHNQRITQTPYERLEESFTLLVAKRWMTQDLVELFTRARCICAAMDSET